MDIQNFQFEQFKCRAMSDFSLAYTYTHDTFYLQTSLYNKLDVYGTPNTFSEDYFLIIAWRIICTAFFYII